jgi:3-hydroxybutyryl-CoA dehydrogenase
MAPPGSDPAVLAGVAGLLGRDGVPVSRIADGAGFIVQRVVAMMVLIACDAAQQRLASPAAIDRAATLGLGYPRGPFALAADLGPARICAIAAQLFAATGDPRFRPSAWLGRRVSLSMPIDLGESSPCDPAPLTGH